MFCTTILGSVEGGGVTPPPPPLGSVSDQDRPPWSGTSISETGCTSSGGAGSDGSIVTDVTKSAAVVGAAADANVLTAASSAAAAAVAAAVAALMTPAAAKERQPNQQVTARLTPWSGPSVLPAPRLGAIHKCKCAPPPHPDGSTGCHGTSSGHSGGCRECAGSGCREAGSTSTGSSGSGGHVSTSPTTTVGASGSSGRADGDFPRQQEYGEGAEAVFFNTPTPAHPLRAALDFPEFSLPDFDFEFTFDFVVPDAQAGWGEGGGGVHTPAALVGPTELPTGPERRSGVFDFLTCDSLAAPRALTPDTLKRAAHLPPPHQGQGRGHDPAPLPVLSGALTGPRALRSPIAPGVMVLMQAEGEVRRLVAEHRAAWLELRLRDFQDVLQVGHGPFPHASHDFREVGRSPAPHAVQFPRPTARGVGGEEDFISHAPAL